MIRTESEYKEAVERLEAEKVRLQQHRAHFISLGLSEEEVERAMQPLISFHLQLGEEVESYERLLRGDTAELSNLHDLGRVLVGLRIALKLSQRELAKRLGVNDSQVSRDERNEYRGISLDRATRILDALGVEVKFQVQQPSQDPERDHSAVS